MEKLSCKTEAPVERRKGDREGRDRLFPLIFHELERIAARELTRIGSVDQISPAALVDEAFARLTARGQLCAGDRGRFLAVCATAMRRILVRRARQGDVRRLSTARPIAAGRDRLLGLDDALDRLADIEERMARVAELRFFGGLTDDEVARQLDIDAQAARRSYCGARALLTLAIADQDAATPPA